MNARQVSGRRLSTVLLGVVALLAALLVPSAGAQQADCGPIVPTREITRGMQGEGLTVVQGTTPETFEVEVLGVLDDGIGVDRDMIIVEVSAPFLDEAGGIWQGMSGSPIYVGDRLLGAISYGLAFTSSNIGGVTPAEDMVDLVDLPAGEQAFAASQRSAPVTVTGDLAHEIAARTGQTSFSQSGVGMRPLPLPLSVSGLSTSRLDTLQAAADRVGLGVTAYAGSRAGYDQTAAPAPVPGGNLAVAQSLGDVTSAAVGTATLVCDGTVVGFGHPFFLSGPTTAGGATAEAIAIIPDDSFAPYKLANIGDLFGTVDQDRFAGVRADVGALPDTTPVTSRVEDLDTGASRQGRTDVITPEAVPDIAAFHLLSNLDSVMDRIGPGTSTLTYTVTGSGDRTGAFSLVRENVYASPFDIAFESIFEMVGDVATLAGHLGEEVAIDGVDLRIAVEEAVSTYEIDEVRIGVDGAPPTPSDGFEIIVQPGSTISLEVDLSGTPDGAEQTVPLSLVVPDDAYGFASLTVSGGGFAGFPGEECFFDPSLCAGDEDAETMQDLADSLAERPRNDELTARLDIQRIGDPGQPPGPTPTETAVPGQPTAEPTPVPASADGPAYAQAGEPVIATVQLDRVVQGLVGYGLTVDSPFCPDCPPVFLRVAGEDRVGTALSTAYTAFGFAETVVLAPADDYPAALVAGPFAASQGAPVLLTADGQLSPGVAEGLQPPATTRVVIVAPDGQLGADVEQQLGTLGIAAIERIGGADRYELAANVARRMGGARAYLVEGENPDPARGWPDAVSAGPVAALEAAPILLTRSGDLPAATHQVLDQMGIPDVVIAGGTAAVGQAVEDALPDVVTTVERIAGADRYETSYLLAQRAIGMGACTCNTWVVTGTDFPDALSAAPAVAWTGGVMVMADGQDVTRSPAAVQYFTDIQYTAPFVTFVGGFAAISQTVEEQVFGILIGQGAGPAGGGTG
jgi:putative cell wall-binding protein